MYQPKAIFKINVVRSDIDKLEGWAKHMFQEQDDDSPNSIYRHLAPIRNKSSNCGSSSNSNQDQKDEDADDNFKSPAKNTRSKNWLKQSPGLPSAGGSGSKPSHAIVTD